MDKIDSSGFNWQQAVKCFLDAIANTDPAPGGGAAAGISGAMGCALGQMAVGISMKSSKIDASVKSKLGKCWDDLGETGKKLQEFAEIDAAAFEAVMKAIKLPKAEPGRKELIQVALFNAAKVPLETSRCAMDALASLQQGRKSIISSVSSDMNCALHLLRVSVLCALENVDINLKSIKDSTVVERLRAEVVSIRKGLSASSS